MRTASLGSTIAFVAFVTSSGAAHAGSLSADVERQAQQNLPELLDLLAIPNVADQPADIQRNATFLEQAFASAASKCGGSTIPRSVRLCLPSSRERADKHAQCCCMRTSTVSR